MPVLLCDCKLKGVLSPWVKGSLSGIDLQLCFAVFLGGAVLADIMKDKPSFWVSKEEYEEDPHRALTKCGAL